MRDTLKGIDAVSTGMEVEVTIVGEGTQTVDLEEPTYDDVLEAVGLSRESATPLVDGRPVPADRAVEGTAVEVLRIVHGG
ncbi:MAG: ubiquitin-like small modifier protein SAMP2 [Halobacteriales archaeon]